MGACVHTRSVRSTNSSQMTSSLAAFRTLFGRCYTSVFLLVHHMSSACRRRWGRRFFYEVPLRKCPQGVPTPLGRMPSHATAARDPSYHFKASSKCFPSILWPRFSRCGPTSGATCRSPLIVFRPKTCSVWPGAYIRSTARRGLGAERQLKYPQVFSKTKSFGKYGVLMIVFRNPPGERELTQPKHGKQKQGWHGKALQHKCK